LKLKRKELLIRGTPISQGIAIGTLVAFTHVQKSIPEREIPKDEVRLEIRRYEKALKFTKKDLQRLKKLLEMDHSHEAAAILETHLQLLDDPILVTEVKEKISESRKNADFVFQGFLLEYQQRFEEIQDLFFRERGYDLLDISRRVLEHLGGSERASLASIPPNSIVFSDEISASDVAEANLQNICAIVSHEGSSTSHAAIVAKAKGIPFIANVSSDAIEEAMGTDVIVDARSGDLILYPAKRTLGKYEKAEQQIRDSFHELEKICSLQAETYDGYPMGLMAILRWSMKSKKCMHMDAEEWVCFAPNIFT